MLWEAMMSDKNIAKNYLFNLCYQILVVLTPILTMPYLSRVIGAEGIGVYSYTYSIASTFSLIATFGTATYAQREIACYQEDKKKISILFWEMFFLRVLLCSACGVVYVIFIMHRGDIKIGLIQGLYLVGTASEISWFFWGIEEFKEVVKRNIFIKIVTILFIFFFVKNSDDLLIYIFGMAFLPLLGYLLTWFYLPRFLVRISIFELRPLRHLRYSVKLFIPAVAVQIYTVLDKTMLGFFVSSKEESGFYEQSSSLVRICLTLFTTVGIVMLPRISNMFANNNKEGIINYLRKMYQFVWFLGLPICVGLFFLISSFVPWFFGVGYDEVSILVKIFCPLIVLSGLNNVTGTQYLIPARKEHIYTITVVIGAGVNVILNYFLIPFFGARGAASASVIAELMITVVQLFYVIYIGKMLKWRDIIMTSWKYFLATALMGGLLWNIAEKVSTTFMGTMLLLISGVLSYFFVLLVSRDVFVYTLIGKLKEKLLRKEN